MVERREQLPDRAFVQIARQSFFELWGDERKGGVGWDEFLSFGVAKERTKAGNLSGNAALAEALVQKEAEVGAEKLFVDGGKLLHAFRVEKRDELKKICFVRQDRVRRGV